MKKKTMENHLQNWGKGTCTYIVQQNISTKKIHWQVFQVFAIIFNRWGFHVNDTIADFYI